MSAFKRDGLVGRPGSFGPLWKLLRILLVTCSVLLADGGFVDEQSGDLLKAVGLSFDGAQSV